MSFSVDKEGEMAAEDVLITAAERGLFASRSTEAGNNVLGVLKVFNVDLLAQIRDDDVPGIMVPTAMYRGGKWLRGGVVLALQDRALVGWMRGILKKPTVVVLPYASFSSVRRDSKVVSGSAQPMPAIVVTAEEQWEFLCAPEVPEDAPLYDLLTRILAGELAVTDFPAGAQDAVG